MYIPAKYSQEEWGPQEELNKSHPLGTIISSPRMA